MNYVKTAMADPTQAAELAGNAAALDILLGTPEDAADKNSTELLDAFLNGSYGVGLGLANWFGIEDAGLRAANTAQEVVSNCFDVLFQLPALVGPLLIAAGPITDANVIKLLRLCKTLTQALKSNAYATLAANQVIRAAALSSTGFFQWVPQSCKEFFKNVVSQTDFPSTAAAETLWTMPEAEALALWKAYLGRDTEETLSDLLWRYSGSISSYSWLIRRNHALLSGALENSAWRSYLTGESGDSILCEARTMAAARENATVWTALKASSHYLYSMLTGARSVLYADAEVFAELKGATEAVAVATALTCAGKTSKIDTVTTVAKWVADTELTTTNVITSQNVLRAFLFFDKTRVNSTLWGNSTVQTSIQSNCPISVFLEHPQFFNAMLRMGAAYQPTFDTLLRTSGAVIRELIADPAWFSTKQDTIGTSYYGKYGYLSGGQIAVTSASSNAGAWSTSGYPTVFVAQKMGLPAMGDQRTIRFYGLVNANTPASAKTSLGGGQDTDDGETGGVACSYAFLTGVTKKDASGLCSTAEKNCWMRGTFAAALSV